MNRKKERKTKVSIKIKLNDNREFIIRLCLRIIYLEYNYINRIDK